jgi:GMP synthase (glutamine-hydrolysing)
MDSFFCYTTHMQKIVILDFGGQYCHLIARRIREAGVYAEVLPADTSASKLKKIEEVAGVIFSGGAASVFDKTSPQGDKKILELGLPVLGICYGHQLIAHMLGGKVSTGESGEYGLTDMNVTHAAQILAGFPKQTQVWMNHRDVVERLPNGFMTLATTEHAEHAAYASADGRICGVQYHPEVSHTKNGDEVLQNFIFEICGCGKEWSSGDVAKNIIEEAAATIGSERAIIGLSGGIDSSVAAALVGKAIGKQLVAVYVDTGLMRHQETEFIKEAFAKQDLDLRIVKAGPRYFKSLKGVEDPEKKRKIIGKLFVDIFTEVAKKEKANFLIQGTIYSDRIESGATKHSSNIKSHHNVGGLPKNLKLTLYEPLRELYKDEVRAIAKAIGLPKDLATRQVFPGPGLAIRIIGEVTPKRTTIVREASRIIEEELKGTKYWKHIWMAFAVLLPIKSVGIQGDERSYKHPIVLRIVESRDAMTATYAHLPHTVLERISTRITNEVKEVNRVVYDITHKPPATMEWE